MSRVDISARSYIVTRQNARKVMGDLGKRLEDVIENISDISKDELENIGKEIIDDSDKRAPKDTHELVNSSYLISESDSENITVEVGYEDPKSVYQHELYGDSYKNPTTPGTEPRFLLNAANKVESEIVDRIAKAIKEELKT